MVDLLQARALELTVQAAVEPRFLDAMGHMNVSWYVHLFNRGIWTFFERHGLNERYLSGSNRGMFALEETLRYFSELREGNALSVHTGLLEVRPKTARMLQYMVDEQKQTVAAVREVVAAHIDLATRCSTAFEDSVRAELDAAPVAHGVGLAMTEAAAQQFARDWVAAWNRRDVEAVLAHFAEDAVFISPKAERIVGNARIQGKAALRSYWQAALAQITSLHFTLDVASWSPRSETLTVRYQAALGGAVVRAAEVMQFRNGSVVQGEAFYGAAAVAP